MQALLQWIAPVMGLVIIIPIALLALPTARAEERDSDTGDRLHLIASAAEIVAVAALVRLIGTWNPLTILGWYAVIAVAAVALAGLVLRAAPLPWVAPAASPRRRMIRTGLSVAFSAALIVVPPLL